IYDGIAHYLNRSHERRVAHLLGDRGQARRFLGWSIVRNSARRIRLQERVAQRAKYVVCNAARIVASRQQVVDTYERAGNILVRCRLENREPLLEWCATKRDEHSLCIEVTVARRECLVEERKRVARRTGGATSDDIECLGIGFDALVRENLGKKPHE